jgi:hypothetical protein
MALDSAAQQQNRRIVHSSDDMREAEVGEPVEMAELSTIPSERYDPAPWPKSFNSALLGDVPEHFQLIVVK